MDQRIVIIADRYGYDSQSRQLIEEMAELTQAINKLWRKRLDCGKVEFTCEDEFRNKVEKTPEMESLLQEIADVEVCLEQMRYMLEADEAIDRYKEEKICRQVRRICEEE